MLFVTCNCMDLKTIVGSNLEQESPLQSDVPIVCATALSDTTDTPSDCEIQVLDAHVVSTGDSGVEGNTVHVEAEREELIFEKRGSAFTSVRPCDEQARRALLMLRRGIKGPNELNGQYWTSGPRHSGKRSPSARNAEMRRAMDLEESYPAVYFKIGNVRRRVGPGGSSLVSRTEENDAASALMCMVSPVHSSAPSENNVDLEQPAPRTSPRDPYAQQRWHQAQQLVQHQQKLKRQQQTLPPIPNLPPLPPPDQDDGGCRAGEVRTWCEAHAARCQQRLHANTVLPQTGVNDCRVHKLALSYDLAFTQNTKLTFDAYMHIMRGRQASTFKAAIVLALSPNMDPKEVARRSAAARGSSFRVEALALHIRMHRAFTRPVLKAAWASLPTDEKLAQHTDAVHAKIATSSDPLASVAAAKPQLGDPPASVAAAKPQLVLDSPGTTAATEVTHAVDQRFARSRFAACSRVFDSVGPSLMAQQEASFCAELKAVQAKMPQSRTDLLTARASKTARDPTKKLDALLEKVHVAQKSPGEQTPREASERMTRLHEHVNEAASHAHTPDLVALRDEYKRQALAENIEGQRDEGAAVALEALGIHHNDEKMVEILRTNFVDAPAYDSDEELERVCANVLARRPDLAKPSSPLAPAPVEAPPVGWQDDPQRRREQDIANFCKWNRRLPFDPRACNPGKVPPRDQFDSCGKEIPDPNEELKRRSTQMSYEDKKKLPEEFLCARFPLHGALKGDLLWMSLNDGFTTGLGTYQQYDSRFYTEVPSSWPSRMKNDCHVLLTSVPFQNWHLRACLDTSGIVVEKKQWTYSNYGQSATITSAALLRVLLDPKTLEGACFFVHEEQPVYQGKNGDLVEWPKGTCKPPKDAQFRMVDVEAFEERVKQWFNERVSNMQRERAKAASSIDVEMDTQAQALLVQQKKRLWPICKDLLNVASGTFDPTISDPGLPLPIDLADLAVHNVLGRLSAFYHFGVAASETTLTAIERRRIVQFQEEVHADTAMNKWSGEDVLKGIGVLLGKSVEDKVRARCSSQSATMLCGRVAFLKSKQKEFLAFRERCEASGMHRLDVPLAMSFIEPDWQALSPADQVGGKF